MRRFHSNYQTRRFHWRPAIQILTLLLVGSANSFSFPASSLSQRATPRNSNSSSTFLSASPSKSNGHEPTPTPSASRIANIHRNDAFRALAASVATLAILTAPLNVNVVGGGDAWADEWGKETEAPTLFTGETVMVSQHHVIFGKEQFMSIPKSMWNHCSFFFDVGCFVIGDRDHFSSSGLA